MHKRDLRLICLRSGIVRTHLTSDKQIWSLAHLLKPTDFRPPTEIRRHTCDPTKVDHGSYDARRALKPQFLSRNKVVRQFVVDNGRKASPRALQDLLSSSGLDVSYHTCADACAIVKSELFQSDRLQFQLILSYIHEMNKRRYRADIDFDGTTIRRVVVVYWQGIQATSEYSHRGPNMDGTFMKHSSGGTFLVACLRNSNNEIHIVAVAWVSGETKEN
uniref:AlNc14C103G6099 protein n=1 Tax=Albugo laibachii Nc14 TaxID=890382 RepID=F0WHP3_9STRA|nr:AlNc14C103G6099 [Albugo laibachii Nc14]|eukprot:CCA20767.1 AlNc14C103G6099 [Albugo laibachii Nc14]